MKSLSVIMLATVFYLWFVNGLYAADETLRILENSEVRVLYETPRQSAAMRIKDVSPAMFRELENATGLAFDFKPTVIPASSRQRLRAMGGREAFETHCRQWHGQPLQMADAAYRFLIAPRIPVAVLHWDGDDDFAAEAKIHYDRTVAAHLALDVIYALATGVCHRLGQP